ncbi:TPA: YdbL family protein [Escherichia coli]|nr:MULTISPECIES: YdbL family protein [Enterobacteriaceae]MCA7412085.1 YdbL family protein [Escherichia coli]MCA7640309.1 YdbL family protein [Escherichia coli]MCB4482067.1 YdbL family protein [Escherichia coli]MCC4659626.1 YdbL family protein [Escherichia coli]MCC4666583.1 YdbL family protein [Escherichia coli]
MSKSCLRLVAIFSEAMMKRNLMLCFVINALFSTSAMALTLNDARTQGRVGETYNGYLVALKADTETQMLVKRINESRNKSYQQLAMKNNLPVAEVEKLAGQKLVAKAKPGEYIRGINGMWLQK